MTHSSNGIELPHSSMRDLVNSKTGEVSRRIFADADIYHEEMNRIFRCGWLYVGHESQVRNPGDFVLSRMGEESVILVRDTESRIRVFLNTCRHRGMKVCRYDEGNTRMFTCPYHGWGFRNSGELIAVPDLKNAYANSFDKAQWGLVEVAKLETLRGTVWATWNAQAALLQEYLGEAWFGLDNALSPWDGGDGKTELLGSPQKWVIPSNWKIVAENFAGDMMHNVSHASVDRVGIGPNEKSGRRDNSGQPMLGTYPEGHGMIFVVTPNDREPSDFAASPATAQYFLECFRARKKTLGERAHVYTAVGTIFPNMSFHGYQPRTILVAHPRGPNQTEMWRVYFVEEAAPREVKDYLRHYYMRYSGPAGMTEQDDMENWNYATASCRGRLAQDYPFNYKAGLGTGGTHPLIPGKITQQPIITEQNTRGLYQRWAEMMDAGYTGKRTP